jgi:hypothetical protein
MIIRNFLAASVVTACLSGWTCFSGSLGVAGPLDPEVNTDGFSPAAEIDDINETRRRDLIARQWDLNLQFYGWGGYGYGPEYVDRSEPWWQGVPGYLWGYRRPWPIRQPIGHESAQTGPNRWTYRPLYDGPEELPAPNRRHPMGPNVVGPQLPGPAEPAPDLVPPAGRRKNRRFLGAREF